MKVYCFATSKNGKSISPSLYLAVERSYGYDEFVFFHGNIFHAEFECFLHAVGK